MKFAVEVAAVESSAKQLDDAVAAVRRIGVARRLSLVESALPGWPASRAASGAGEFWGQIEASLTRSLGGQAQALLAAARGYQELEAAATSVFGSGR